MLLESLDTMMQQTKSVMMHVDADHHSTLHSHNQQLLRQQLEALGSAVSKLQVTFHIYSTAILKSRQLLISFLERIESLVVFFCVKKKLFCNITDN